MELAVGLVTLHSCVDRDPVVQGVTAGRRAQVVIYSHFYDINNTRI